MKNQNTEIKLVLTEVQKSELYSAIRSLDCCHSVFGHDEDGKCSVNTSFISKHGPVYFDYDSYEESIYAMIDYFELCMNSKRSILADSLRKIGFPDLNKFNSHVASFAS